MSTNKTALRIAYGMYKLLMCTHTNKMQALQTGLIFAAGDLVTQKLTKKPEDNYDFLRTGKFAVVGLALGPATHQWYRLLDDFIGRRKNFKTVVQKVIADQMVMAPLIVAWVLGVSSLLGCEDLLDEAIIEDLKNKYSDKLLENYKVLPFVQMVNFVLPINFRVFFYQSIALGLNSYASFKNKNGEDTKDLMIKEV